MNSMLKAALPLLAALAATQAPAQTAVYPARPIRAIVPFAPGGATDIMARQLGQKLSEQLGQQVIIDNRPGGGGIIAAVMAKDAPPDGYTIFFGTISTLATNVATKPDLPYRPMQDYAPITLTSSNPYFMVINPNVPVRTVKEFIDLAKAKPGQLNFGSSGTGGGAHLAQELFRYMARIDMVHIPYKGAALAMTDVLGGQIQMTFSQPAVMLPHAKAGRLRVLGVTSTKPLHSWPDAPPIAQAVPGYEASSWQGIVAPAKTPKPLLERLHKEAAAALRSPEVEGRLLAEGSQIWALPPDEFRRYIQNEISKWVRLVKEAKIQVE